MYIIEPLIAILSTEHMQFYSIAMSCFVES